MLNRTRTALVAAPLLVLALAACGARQAAPAAQAKPAVASVASGTKATTATARPAATPVLLGTKAATTGEAGGEGGGEAPLVTYSDARQGFSISRPAPWTQDMTVKTGAKFAGGDGLMTLDFVAAPAGKDPMTYATADVKAAATAFNTFKQVELVASTEVTNSVVLDFEAMGKSAVTNKDVTERGDRYYIPLKDGRLAVLTVMNPMRNYDREGVRDIALTLKLTK